MTTAGVTPDAQRFIDRNPQLDAITYPALARMLNKAFGAMWPSRIDAIIAAEKAAQGSVPRKQ